MFQDDFIPFLFVNMLLIPTSLGNLMAIAHFLFFEIGLGEN